MTWRQLWTWTFKMPIQDRTCQRNWKIPIQPSAEPGVWCLCFAKNWITSNIAMNLEFRNVTCLPVKNKIKYVRTPDYHFWLEEKYLDTSNFYNTSLECIIYHELEFLSIHTFLNFFLKCIKIFLCVHKIFQVNIKQDVLSNLKQRLYLHS